jgi:hypothetical protein
MARPPLWVRSLDAIVLVALILSGFVLVSGGFVIHLGAIRLPARSAVKLLFIAAAAFAIRHAAHPTEPLQARLMTRYRALNADSPPIVVAGTLLSRVAVVLIGYLAVVTVGMPSAGAGLELSSDPMLNLPARFDAGWYGGIALDGYVFEGRFDRQQNVAFFPAVPLLMRAGGHLAGAFAAGIPRSIRMARVLWVGVAISIVAFAWAAVYLARLARDLIGEPKALNAVWLMAAYPFAVFFSAPYTESVFFLAAVAAFYYLRRDRWLAAAAWGVLAGLTRPNGFLISIPLAWTAVANRWYSQPVSVSEKAPLASLASATAPIAGMAAYSAYVKHLTGSWFGWARLHEAWGRTFHGTEPVARGVEWIGSQGLARLLAERPYDFMNALGLIFALALLWPVYRRLGFLWVVFVVIAVAPPLAAGGLLSMGRITAPVFPLFIALASILPRRFVPPVVTAFALLQSLVAILFFTWRPIF